ncbi:hypothetical protein GZH46_01953, partial [Fragariocoptes setiger]
SSGCVCHSIVSLLVTVEFDERHCKSITLLDKIKAWRFTRSKRAPAATNEAQNFVQQHFVGSTESMHRHRMPILGAIYATVNNQHHRVSNEQICASMFANSLTGADTCQSMNSLNNSTPRRARSMDQHYGGDGTPNDGQRSLLKRWAHRLRATRLSPTSLWRSSSSVTITSISDNANTDRGQVSQSHHSHSQSLAARHSQCYQQQPGLPPPPPMSLLMPQFAPMNPMSMMGAAWGVPPPPHVSMPGGPAFGMPPPPPPFPFHHADFPLRPPPPSYQASMQDYRYSRMMLLANERAAQLLSNGSHQFNANSNVNTNFAATTNGQPNLMNGSNSTATTTVTSTTGQSTANQASNNNVTPIPTSANRTTMSDADQNSSISISNTNGQQRVNDNEQLTAASGGTPLSNSVLQSTSQLSVTSTVTKITSTVVRDSRDAIIQTDNQISAQCDESEAIVAGAYDSTVSHQPQSNNRSSRSTSSSSTRQRQRLDGDNITISTDHQHVEFRLEDNDKASERHQLSKVQKYRKSKSSHSSRHFDQLCVNSTITNSAPFNDEYTSKPPSRRQRSHQSKRSKRDANNKGTQIDDTSMNDRCQSTSSLVREYDSDNDNLTDTMAAPVTTENCIYYSAQFDTESQSQTPSSPSRSPSPPTPIVICRHSSGVVKLDDEHHAKTMHHQRRSGANNHKTVTANLDTGTDNNERNEIFVSNNQQLNLSAKQRRASEISIQQQQQHKNTVANIVNVVNVLEDGKTDDVARRAWTFVPAHHHSQQSSPTKRLSSHQTNTHNYKTSIKLAQRHHQDHLGHRNANNGPRDTSSVCDEVKILGYV